MNRSALVPMLAFFILAVASVQGEAWTSKDGRTIQADFVRVEGAAAVLRIGGDERKIPLDRLAPSSRMRAEALQAEMVSKQARDGRVAQPAVLAGAVTDADLIAFRQVLAGIANWRTLLVDQAKVPPIEQRSAQAAFASLLKLERDLSTLATVPESIVVAPNPGIEGISPANAEKITKLRQEILKAEHEEIRAALKVGGAPGGKVSERKRQREIDDGVKRVEKIYELELSLDKLYGIPAGRLTKQITTTGKQLKKESSASITDDQEIARLSAQLEGLKLQLNGLFEVCYGFKKGDIFSAPALVSAENPVAELMREIHAKRREVEAYLLGDQEAGREGDKQEGLIGGYYVYSANLGVVLDISGSMTAHIEPLKYEIEQSFPDAVYKEVQGCMLEVAGQSMHPRPIGFDTMAVVEELVLIRRVDTIYWFCDLQDPQSVQALRHLRLLLLRGDVAFHVKSVGRRPSDLLAPLITEF